MPQKEILENILTAIRQRDVSTARGLILSKTDIPDSNSLNVALIQAAASGLWETVNEICQITGDNQPDQVAVDEVLLPLCLSLNTRHRIDRLCKLAKAANIPV